MLTEPGREVASVHELGTSINYYLQSIAKTLLIVRFI